MHWWITTIGTIEKYIARNEKNPAATYLSDDEGFGEALETIVSAPIEEKPRGSMDMYIYDKIIVTVDMGDNVERLRQLIP